MVEILAESSSQNHVGYEIHDEEGVLGMEVKDVRDLGTSEGYPKTANGLKRGEVFVLLTSNPAYLPHFKYATLSHMWGSKPSEYPQLTTKCLEDFKVLIPQDSFPVKYHDAIRISKALELDYLWIDSLCIIQDYLEDWRQEALKRADVYSNSPCNISYIFPPLVESNKEHLRDPRVERSHASYREDGTQPRIKTPGHFFPEHGCFKKVSFALEMSTMVNPAIRTYRLFDLTCETDRAITFAGIAKVVQAHTKFTYLAGILEEFAPIDHLWSISATTPLAEFYLKVGLSPSAPTWSWCSVFQALV
ncbi:hypothetical protein FZEAL_7287 [Fusarium zealandicum]|uniref:Heterokaryon incompatibility domain-containing protein n=1 Tax=Fusarium zealandicum TaxID=1053134 RepID=A0A8H4XI07_9HYPO|nr:hypothetical protein FZEAL_7287 [Fusarium zealandicum]